MLADRGLVCDKRVPAERRREVNRVLEDTARGPDRTELYPAYDDKAIGEQEHAKTQ